MDATTTEARTVIRTDAEVLRDVLQELAWDTRVRESDVGVHVRHGVVTLTGAVENYSQKVAAA
ncbi:MAG: BON domain-containing protein, partial [Thermoanaerobaculia bacterium]